MLSFPRFKVESHYNCDYDYLQIHDGPSTSSHLIGRYCGQVPPGGGTLNSTHNQVYLWFHSDATVSSDGFTVSWLSAAPSKKLILYLVILQTSFVGESKDELVNFYLCCLILVLRVKLCILMCEQLKYVLNRECDFKLLSVVAFSLFNLVW